MLARRIIIAEPHGFCAGVRRAIEAVERAMQRHDAVYCYNELVHNRRVVDSLRERGVFFVKRAEEVPAGAVLLFSAHGVAPDVRAAAQARRLRVIDATCPVVDKVHREVRRYAGEGRTVLLIGHHGHDEIVGVQGEAPECVIVIQGAEEAGRVSVPDPTRVAAVSQTTLSVDETADVLAILRSRFPQLVTPPDGDICHATTNRQRAVKALAGEVGLVLVLGSAGSSNSRRLVEVARAAGGEAVLIEAVEDLDPLTLQTAGTVGLTAGASTPELSMAEIIDALKARGFSRVERMAAAVENVRFKPPADLF